MTPRPLLAFLLVALLPAPAPADTTCTLGTARRLVSVEPATGGVPCAVRYTKEPGGLDEVLWRAESDRRFCEEKAADLVGRLLNAAWTCDGEVPGAPPGARADAPPNRLPPIAAPPPPIERIEEPPPEFQPEPLTLRDRIVLDPRMRFYRSSFGEAALREALRILPVDLNQDGRDELFLQVDLPQVCGDAACTWDLFELRPDMSLAALGVRGVMDWRVLADRHGGYPDLAVRFAGGVEAEYGVLRFELGMYRLVEESVSPDVFASDATPATPR